MTRIDFYLLQDSAAERLRFACRLAEKAYRTGSRVYIQTASRDQAAQLDELLWTFRAGSFVPHTLAGTAGAAAAPVVIGAQDAPGAAAELLVNLAPAVPQTFRDYQRVAEIIDQNDDNKKAGRERFRFYKDNGCEPETHTIPS